MKALGPISNSSSPGTLRTLWRRSRWYLLALYAALLLVSHAARRVAPVDDAPAVPFASIAAQLPALDAKGPASGTIRLAYLDTAPNGSSAPTPIVLVHGSPGEAADFKRLAPLLPNRRLIIADLPGFGASTRDLPDYSFRTHAKYLLALLDRLKIARAHWVGFSMGGGVALSAADLAPERVASITMLSAIGVQEMELLGEYRMNHAVHGAQLAFFWALREGLPLTPRAYARDIAVSYSRNFYDSDQRPLREILKQYDGPMRILHGRKDFLVPVEAAIEHHRLVPQSELEISEKDHFMVFQDPSFLAPRIEDFVARADAGRARRRTDADAEARARAEAPLDPRMLPKFIGVTAIVVMGLLALATLVSEDLTCIGAGVIAAQGRMSFLLASLACFLGIFLGDILLFLAGRWVGRAALARIPLRWMIREEDVRRSSAWFARRGAGVIFASRFMPGARLPTYFAAGALRTSFWRFTLYFCVACAVWTPILVGLSMLLGREVIESALLGGQSLLARVAIAGVLLLLLIRLSIRLATWKGRRLLLSSWLRVRHWEFWPMWAFYPPVVAYIGWLMLKHRSLTMFTAANPAIPGSGFVGESKAQILAGLEAGPAARDALPRWRLLPAATPAEERIAEAIAFVRAHGLAYPIVLKPDAGQRGAGVVIAKNEAEVAATLRGARADLLLQEFAPGQEFGVFYYRLPAEPRGRIFAITEKRFPTVTGDGQSTLEQLILRDPRAVCIARLLLKSLAGRLDATPAAGEIVSLVEVGAHARGTLFLDGGWVKTEALEAAIDALCQGYDGFYFGRFDLRTPDVEAFRDGRNFKVIELNGVTSEATSIYDPRNSVFAAWRTLFVQWRLAFEIGAANRRAGAPLTPVRTLLKWWMEHQEQ